MEEPLTSGQKRVAARLTESWVSGMATRVAIVASGYLLSRLLGVLRNTAFAHAFGTSPEMGAYVVASRLPDIIFQVVAGATMASAFIPVFARYMAHRSEEDAWRLASSVLNLVFLATLTLALVAFVAAPWLVPLTAPGLGEDVGRRQELIDLAVELTRFMLISPILFAVSGMFTGILNARQHFLLPALAPSVYNLSIIAGAVFLAGPLGVRGLAVGVVAGAGLYLLVQVPGLVRVGMRYRWIAQWRDPGVQEVVRLMLPRTLGLAAAQANFVIATFFASKVSDQAISGLTYAWALATMPLALFGMAIATAVFPTLAEQAASDNPDEARSTIATSLRFILFLTIPATVGVILLREPVVSLLLERGAFDQASADLTSSALLFYALGLPAHAAIEILSRGFYAIGDTRTPVAMAVMSMLINLVLAAALFMPLEHRGIALAMTLAVSAEAWGLFTLLRRRLGTLDEEAIAASLVRTAVASLLMAEVVVIFLLGSQAMGVALQGATVDAFFLILGGTILGGAAFFTAALALRCQEAQILGQRLRRSLIP